jgi:hypothetical protein
VFEHFADALPRANIVAWTKQVQDFGQGRATKNPYEPDGKGTYTYPGHAQHLP